MKRLIIILLAGIFMMTLNVSHSFAYPKPVARITNYDHDNLAERISILRANGEPNSSAEYLYPKDKITGDIKAVNFECAPYAKPRLEGDAYVIYYDPPSTLEKIRDNALELARNFWNNNVEFLKSGASRGHLDAVDLIPQPGFDVTLLSSQNVIFSWYESDNNIFSITDEKGDTIFEENVKGLTSIEINLKDINLQAGKQYFWNVDGDPQKLKITMLNKKTERMILAKLAEIDSENISENERILKKITYVQLISDIYPEQIDLYWLSEQWLLDFQALTDEDNDYQQILINKCLSHLDSKIF